VKLLGDGTFGRVFEVRQIHNNKVYALKMVRAVERFVDAAIVI
jgi:serine/threonine protein kinase